MWWIHPNEFSPYTIPKGREAHFQGVASILVLKEDGPSKELLVQKRRSIAYAPSTQGDTYIPYHIIIVENPLFNRLCKAANAPPNCLVAPDHIFRGPTPSFPLSGIKQLKKQSMAEFVYCTSVWRKKSRKWPQFFSFRIFKDVENTEYRYFSTWKNSLF